MLLNFIIFHLNSADNKRLFTSLLAATLRKKKQKQTL